MSDTASIVELVNRRLGLSDGSSSKISMPDGYDDDDEDDYSLPPVAAHSKLHEWGYGGGKMNSTILLVILIVVIYIAYATRKMGSIRC